MGLANISIVGNLVKAPEQIQLASGKLKTTLVVAVNHAKKNESESADFYNVVAWGRLAELAGQYLDKGQQVTAAGRLTLDRWTDKNGQARVTPVVSADQIAFPRRTQPDYSSGGDTDMGKTFSKSGKSVASMKFKEAEVDDENFDEIDENLGDEDDEDEQIVERVKGVFADQPPVKGGRKSAKTA
ncbi:MAG: single-stranded DNA-binding protein [Candidatus Melainabacteria bacterium]|nr:single-stranded DNA-binding protein [Candidatus Melainabacteria bacterium]